MNTEKPMTLILLIMILICPLKGDQDTLTYPELMNLEAMDDPDDNSTASIKLAFEDAVNFRVKAKIAFNGSTLSYWSEGDNNENIKQKVSFGFSWKAIFLNCGQGYVNVAHGIILGNTMMRYTPSFSGQAGLRSVKLKTGTSAQYKGLSSLGLTLNKLNLTLFRFNGSLCGVLELKHEFWQSGVGLYINDDIIMELWTVYKKDKIQTSLDISATTKQMNHVSADVLYKYNGINFFSSIAWLSSEFISIKSDSKWGSGLRQGGRGLALGMNYIISPWKISGIVCGCLSASRLEDRRMFEIRYNKKPLEITGVYALRHINEIKENDCFPFNLNRVDEIKHNIKLSVKIQVNKAFRIICQCQGDPAFNRSYVGLVRLEYKKLQDMIKFQVTSCCGYDNDLYFVRPAGTTYYGIRKAPTKETQYVDLIYIRRFGPVNVSILLRNEGMSFGMDYEL